MHSKLKKLGLAALTATYLGIASLNAGCVSIGREKPTIAAEEAKTTDSAEEQAEEQTLPDIRFLGKAYILEGYVDCKQVLTYMTPEESSRSTCFVMHVRDDKKIEQYILQMGAHHSKLFRKEPESRIGGIEYLGELNGYISLIHKEMELCTEALLNYTRTEVEDAARLISHCEASLGRKKDLEKMITLVYQFMISKQGQGDKGSGDENRQEDEQKDTMRKERLHL